MSSARMLSERTAQWATIALGVSIPISVALDNVLLVVVLAGWLFAGDFRETLRVIKRSRTVLAALVLYGLLLVGTLYGDRDTGDATRILVKYLNLLFIPLFAVLLRTAHMRRLALLGFAASLGLMLFLSYLAAAGVPFPGWIMPADSPHPTVFKRYLTHGILIAFASFLFAQLAFASSAQRQRAFWTVAALLAAAYVMLLSPGRTGHLMLGVLALYLGYSWKRWRGVAVAAAVTASCVAVLVQVPGPFQQLYGPVAGGQQSLQSSERARISNQSRIDFYRASLAIVQEHPFLGVGTGGFTRAYADKTRGTDAFPTRNPHNEYLLMTVQLGLAGLVALLYLFWQHWRESARLATPIECRLARGLVLAIAVGCLFNSLLLDHTEGLLYAWLTGVLFGGLESRRDA